MADKTDVSKPEVIISEEMIAVSLSDENKRDLQRCIAAGNKVSIHFEEVSTTSLPRVVRAGVNID